MTLTSMSPESSEWIEKYQPFSVPPFAKWAEQYQTVFLAFDTCFEATELSVLCHKFIETHEENNSTALILARSSISTTHLESPTHPSLIQIKLKPNQSDLFHLLASVHALILPNLQDEVQPEALAAFLMNRPDR